MLGCNGVLQLTVGLDVVTAALNHSRNLSVDGVETEFGLCSTSSLFHLQLIRVRKLQSFQ